MSIASIYQCSPNNYRKLQFCKSLIEWEPANLLTKSSICTFTDHKDHVTDLLKRIYTMGVWTMEVV